MNRMKKPPELLPCPFCGGKPDVEDFLDGDRLICCDCPAAPGVVNKSKLIAARQWNERKGQKHERD